MTISPARPCGACNGTQRYHRAPHQVVACPVCTDKGRERMKRGEFALPRCLATLRCADCGRSDSYRLVTMSDGRRRWIEPHPNRCKHCASA